MADTLEASMEKIRLLVPRKPVVLVDGVVQRKDHSLETAIDAIGVGKFQIEIGFASFLCLVAESMQIYRLAILGPLIQCEWNLTLFEVALITSVPFLGGALGSYLWGVYCDKFGRRSGLLLGSALLLYFEVIGVFVPNLVWLLITRFLVGFASGALPQAVTYFAEFLPRKLRGIYLSFAQFGYCLGGVFAVALAMGVVPHYGWRWYLILCNLPVFLFLLMLTAIPESPYFYVSTGQRKEATEVVKGLADENMRVRIPGAIRIDNDEERGNFLNLFQTKDFAISTFLIVFLSFVGTALFSGVILLTTDVFAKGQTLCKGHQDLIIECQDGCEAFGTEGYVRVLLIAAAQLPGVLLSIIFVDVVGRRVVLIVSGFFFSIIFASLMLCINSWVATTVLLFVSKMLITTVIIVIFLYIPEVYPTAVRSLAVGVGHTGSRIGLVLSPLDAQVFSHFSAIGALGIYVVLGLLFIMTASALPFETKGKAMMTSVDSQYQTDDEEWDD